MSNLLEGKKTYAGLVIILVGFFGGAQLISEAEIATTIDSILQLVGIGIAIYGRYKTKGNK